MPRRPLPVTIALFALLVAPRWIPGVQGDTAISQHAHDLHFRSLVIDTHADTTQRVIYDHFDIGVRHQDGDIDIPRMREGGLGGIFFSIWVSGHNHGPEAAKAALQQIAAVHAMVRTQSADLVFCETAQEIRSAHDSGKIAVLMNVEGGHMIDSSLDTLRQFAKQGVRYMTLTHSVNDEWADSSNDKPAHNGLTPFGKDVVREMNRLGMMVDISHVADKTFYDALAVSEAPLIASHSGCRALCNAPRNMTDAMIQALAAKGGVIQINYHVGFLSQQYRDADLADPGLDKQREAILQKRCGKNEACKTIEGEKFMHEMVKQGKLPRVGWEKIIEHIDHAAKLVGADHVGLGSDFDGANMPFGMEDCSQLPKITEALLQKGYSESDVQKILGGNILRVMEQVQATAQRLGGKS
ncbi:MAG: dipeptidase [Candidatus Acidiferrales bacterium]